MNRQITMIRRVLRKYEVTYYDDNDEIKMPRTVTIYDCSDEDNARHFFSLKFKQPKYRNCNFIITKVEPV